MVLALGEANQKKSFSKKVRDVFVLKLSLMLILMLTHYLLNSLFLGGEAGKQMLSLSLGFDSLLNSFPVLPLRKVVTVS